MAIEKDLLKAKAALEKKIKEREAEQKVVRTKKKKTPRKTVKEQYKEIKESLKPVGKTIDEEALIQQLFGDKPVIKPETEETTEVVIPKKTSIWDYSLEDEIPFFDPECTYELTGYKPVNETKGLDFDPEWFTEAARTYENTGKYTEYPQGSKPYADYWNEQYKRCREGYEVNGYRLTGDNYFYLNFYRMQTIVEGRVAGKGRDEKFPSFFPKQYEFFHYVEMAEKLHKDVCILKARGLGLSEVVASLLVRPYTTNRKYKCLLTAPY